MSAPLVLSLFPGIGLLDMAFEEAGFCVVRGPDLLWGGDIRRFHVPAGRFDGVIGGPPCQSHSTASEIRGTDAVDLVPEFVRVVQDAGPTWVVMENVRGVAGHTAIPRAWHATKLRDWDCGGATARTRLFWTWPFWTMEMTSRPGEPSKSVMASTWKRGPSDSQYVTDKGFLPGDLSVEEYGRLQGCEEFAATLNRNLRHSVKLPASAAKIMAVHGLGNGVPLPMGRAIAKAVIHAMYPEMERAA